MCECVLVWKCAYVYVCICERSAVGGRHTKTSEGQASDMESACSGHVGKNPDHVSTKTLQSLMAWPRVLENSPLYRKSKQRRQNETASQKSSISDEHRKPCENHKQHQVLRPTAV